MTPIDCGFLKNRDISNKKKNDEKKRNEDYFHKTYFDVIAKTS